MNPEYTLTKPYSKGPYNLCNDTEQHIRFSEGCPNKCVYCAESWENGIVPIYHEIPEIVRNKVILLDMNFMSKPECLKIIRSLGTRRVDGKIVYYELQCGVDFRYMTQEKASVLKQAHFVNMRLAWDYSYSDYAQIQKAFLYLIYAGYKAEDIQIFMLCNWKIKLDECCKKLDALKFWNCQVSDCWFDNQVSPDIKPIHWSEAEIKFFRDKCRNHNIMCRMRGYHPKWVKK